MLAWVDPVNATEVTRQLAQKGYSISQLRKSDVSIVKATNNDLKVIFKGFTIETAMELSPSITVARNSITDYNSIFSYIVKSSLQADILTWRKRE